MSNLFRTRYRIITDNCAGFEVQYKYPWWPFWIQTGNNGYPVNTHKTLEQAKKFIVQVKSRGVVYYE